jgi:glycosyltransferase involved in cell wall biosynthesis
MSNDFIWPMITILLITYNRPMEIRKVIRALTEKLLYPRDKLLWVICDDGSPQGYVQSVVNDFPEIHFVRSITNRGGWAANVNQGRSYCTTNYIFYCEDDFLALSEIDLMHGVALLELVPDLGIVRYDGIEGHDLNLEQRWVIPTQTPSLHYLRIRKDSPHLNVYSNRPHLEHERSRAAYGAYQTGFRLALTEENYAYRVKVTPGPDVCLLPRYIEAQFAHIGKTWQGTADDIYK